MMIPTRLGTKSERNVRCVSDSVTGREVCTEALHTLSELLPLVRADGVWWHGVSAVEELFLLVRPPSDSDTPAAGRFELLIVLRVDAGYPVAEPPPKFQT